MIDEGSEPGGLVAIPGSQGLEIGRVGEVIIDVADAVGELAFDGAAEAEDVVIGASGGFEVAHGDADVVEAALAAEQRSRMIDRRSRVEGRRNRVMTAGEYQQR